MPGTSRAKNPRGVTIEFEEASHIYKSLIDGLEVKYVSGTTFLGKYFPPFDPTGIITARCAKKEGITVEAMKEKWAAKGRESCRLGTRTHETIEDILHGNTLRNTAENIVEQRRFDNAIKVATKLKNTIDILGIEKIVFDDRLRIAGTIDLFAQSRKDGSYLIIDHKTNAEIEKENKYKKFCFAPISHVPDVAFYHYGLQLNLYSYLLKFGSYVPKDAKFRFYLNHVLPESVNLIELPDMQHEIKDLVIDYLLTNFQPKDQLEKVKPKTRTYNLLQMIDDL